MGRIIDLNDYEKHFYDVMKARGYKHAIIRDSYSTDSQGVTLTHPDKTFRFEVTGNTFSIQTPKKESRGYGVRKKTITKWYTLRNVFTDEEQKAMRDARVVPDLDDIQLVALIAATIKANDEEFAMREVRLARLTALREAAPDMWRALIAIAQEYHDEYGLCFFCGQGDAPFHKPDIPSHAHGCPMELALLALELAGDQDPDDLSITRSGVVGF